MDHSRSWFIPRPSLSSSSSSNTNKSHDSIRCYHRDSEVIDVDRSKQKKNSTVATTSSTASSSLSSNRSKNQIHMETTCINGECDSKRGSRSSQGSSDSEQSIHVSQVYSMLSQSTSYIRVSMWLRKTLPFHRALHLFFSQLQI